MAMTLSSIAVYPEKALFSPREIIYSNRGRRAARVTSDSRVPAASDKKTEYSGLVLFITAEDTSVNITAPQIPITLMVKNRRSV